jgi:hypothetical protein
MTGVTRLGLSFLVLLGASCSAAAVPQAGEPATTSSAPVPVSNEVRSRSMPGPTPDLSRTATSLWEGQPAEVFDPALDTAGQSALLDLYLENPSSGEPTVDDPVDAGPDPADSSDPSVTVGNPDVVDTAGSADPKLMPLSELPEAVSAAFADLELFAADPDAWSVVVSISEQRLWVLNRHGALGEQLVSTGKGGASSVAGSNGTPLGVHRLSWVVRGTPGTIVRGFGPTGRRPTDRSVAHMTTRAFGLVGLEPKNQSSASRGIFVHGTNMPHQLGSPRSGGCIRVADEVSLWLDELLVEGALFTIIR